MEMDPSIYKKKMKIKVIQKDEFNVKKVNVRVFRF